MIASRQESRRPTRCVVTGLVDELETQVMSAIRTVRLCCNRRLIRVLRRRLHRDRRADADHLRVVTGLVDELETSSRAIRTVRLCCNRRLIRVLTPMIASRQESRRGPIRCAVTVLADELETQVRSERPMGSSSCSRIWCLWRFGEPAISSRQVQNQRAPSSRAATTKSRLRLVSETIQAWF